MSSVSTKKSMLARVAVNDFERCLVGEMTPRLHEEFVRFFEGLPNQSILGFKFLLAGLDAKDGEVTASVLRNVLSGETNNGLD